MSQLKKAGVLLWALASVVWLFGAALHKEWSSAILAAATTSLAINAWFRLRERKAAWFTKTATRRLALVAAAAVAVELPFAMFVAAAGLDDSGWAIPVGVLLILGVAAAFYGYWWRGAIRKPNAP